MIDKKYDYEEMMMQHVKIEIHEMEADIKRLEHELDCEIELAKRLVKSINNGTDRPLTVDKVLQMPDKLQRKFYEIEKLHDNLKSFRDKVCTVVYKPNSRYGE